MAHATTSSADTPFYSLCRADVQAVAEEDLGRELTPDEAAHIERAVGNSIPWRDYVAHAITAADFKP